MTDTEAGTPLTATLTTLRDAMRTDPTDRFWEGWDAALMAVEVALVPAIQSRPHQAGLDVERLAEAMISADGVAWPVVWTRNPDTFGWVARQVAAEYARLPVGDGPGPEERLRERIEAVIATWEREPVWTRADVARGLRDALSRPLPENREEPSR